MRVNPSILRFSGFEVLQKISRKLTVSTTSFHSLRMNIINDFPKEFEVKIDKKGKIASGLGQEITISFKGDEYKVYKTKLTIITELGQITVPIEAFPILNPKLCLEFPKVLIFESSLLGNLQIIKKRIISTSEAEFNFEFLFENKTGEFEIWPMNGLLKAKETKEIELRFIPNKLGFVSVDVEVC